MYRLLETASGSLARMMAWLGGAVLLILVVATCLSILGRALLPLDIGLGPILGIYDMTEIGVAAAVFAFLPWCQFNRGHASVDLLKPAFPGAMNRLLDLVIDIAMLIAAAVIAWRLGLGMLDKQSYGETTQILQYPVWQGYAFCLAGAVVFALVALFSVLRSWRALISGEADE